MAYGNFKDLPRKTASDKVLHDQAFNIAKNLYKFFDKKSSGGAAARACSETLARQDKSVIKS